MPKKNRPHHMRPVHIRPVTVQSVTDLTPGMRRVVLEGPSLSGFTTDDGHTIPPVISDGFDDDVRLVFPDPSTGELPPVELTSEGSPVWQSPLIDLFRTYTVRAFDAAAQTLTIDFARHTAGLAEDWSATAQPGDHLLIAGPKASAPFPDDVEWMMFAGDDTALPAIGRALDELPEHMSAVVVVQIKDPGHKLHLSDRPDVHIHWVIGTDYGEACFQTSLPDHLDPAAGFLWAAGEANALRKVRAYAKELGFPKQNTEFVGYWRDTGEQPHGATASPGGAPDSSAGSEPGGVEGHTADGGTAGDASGTEGMSAMEVFEKQTSMLDIRTAIVVREAMALGVFEALTRKPLSTEQLAAATSTRPEDVERVLLFLNSVGMLKRAATSANTSADDDPLWDLTNLSTDLSDPDSFFAMALSGPAWDEGLALLNLASTLRRRAGTSEGHATRPASPTGPTGPASPSNPSNPTNSSSHVQEERAREVFELRSQWWIPQLVDKFTSGVFGEPSVGTVRVDAPHPKALIDALHQVGLDTATDSPHKVSDLVLVDPLATRSGEQFLELLAAARRDGVSRVHIVSVLLSTQQPHDHDLAEDLSRLVRLDGQLPREQSVRDMAQASGWDRVGSATLLDWETALITLA